MKKGVFNNKGFAISSIIYAMLILFLILLTIIMATLSRRKMAFDKTKNNIVNELSYNNKSFEFNASNEFQIFEIPRDGYYRLEVWGQKVGSYGGAYAQLVANFIKGDNLIIDLNAEDANRATISTLYVEKLLNVGNGTDETTSISYGNGQTLTCRKEGNSSVCEGVTITSDQFFYPSIILTNQNMPTFNGLSTMMSNMDNAHAKITYISANRPDQTVLYRYYDNEYTCGRWASVTNYGWNFSENVSNGFKYTFNVSENPINYTLKIVIPDKDYTVRFSGKNVDVNFVNQNGNDPILSGTQTGVFSSNSSGYITIKAKSTSADAEFVVESLAYKGQSVGTANPLIESIEPTLYTSCSNIASNKNGCTSLASSTVNGDVYVVVPNVTGRTRDGYYKNQIFINNNWVNMTDANDYSYYVLHDAGRYKLYTRQFYSDEVTNSACTLLDIGDVNNHHMTTSQISKELNVIISN